MAGNNPSIIKSLYNIMKTMNKEECNNFVIPMQVWILQFTPHILLTPQHNHVKEGKKDKLILNTAEQLTKDTITINIMTSTKHGTELDCTFGKVMIALLIHISNLHISFPD